ncbi:MAG: FtsW/RodA/SpoVE family cell cycle protein [Chloroflexota bacterium]|nr:FtsW/RodA/SpoVE family cell cycle protein [Chloroflexota bacterium]
MKIKNRTRTERILLVLSAIFLVLYASILSFAPVVRARSYDVDLRWTHWLGVLVWLLVFYFAHREISRRLPARDPYLLPIAGFLSGWGLLTIWRLFPNFGLRQTIWLLIAGGILVLGFRLKSDLSFLRRYKYLWLTGGLILTALTLIFGTNPLGNGPHLWLGCCGVYLQPSEPLKLLLVVYLAAYFADQMPFRLPISGDKQERQLSPTSLLPLLAPTFIMAGVTFLLLLVQRDLGTASIFLVLYATLVFLVTGDKRVLLITGFILLLAVVVGYFAFDLVRLRVDAWINPWLDPSGRSYQIVQSVIAVANGGLLGRGPGLGNPMLVPIPHSDFIFAAISEEAGLMGGLGLIILLGLLAHRGLLCALNAMDIFQRYLAAGLTAFLIFQSVLIIGGNLRLLPLTGVTLPFVSYGGSSLVTSFVSLLILLHISSRGRASSQATRTLRPYMQMGIIFFVGVTAIAMALGWWAFWRGPDLLTRTDNPRRAISDLFVRRGSILDRNNKSINASIGSPGDYTRAYLYPDLSATAGYTNPIYGQSGLEASMDNILRGLEGNSGLTIWWNHLLYGQPPPGLDIRTSLNIALQEIADQSFEGHHGTLVLLNPVSGEILVMASHPSFDANRLDEIWGDLIQDPDSPLLNRSTQGLYNPGTALAPLLYAGAIEYDVLPDDPSMHQHADDIVIADCAGQLDESYSWDSVVSNGCQEGVAGLGDALGGERMLDLYTTAGLFSAPQIRLPAESMEKPLRIDNPEMVALGEGVRFSPLQVALALSPLSSAGMRPGALLVAAVESTQIGWLPQEAVDEAHVVISEGAALTTAKRLRSTELPVWESIAVAVGVTNDDLAVSWYLSGTTPDWAGTPLVLVVLVEEQYPNLAKDIGMNIWEYSLLPPEDL